MPIKSKRLRGWVNAFLGFNGQKLEPAIEELKWGQKYQILTAHSEWLSKGVCPGGYAVGYPFLCMEYRILDEIRPNYILELGLGQSTKLTSSYMQYAKGSDKFHCVVEHDPDYLAFMKRSIDFDHSHVELIPLAEQVYKDETVTVYGEFKNRIPMHPYDFILIDGPFGSEGKYSRIEILSIVPEMLAKDFVIMMDDHDREGEQNTCRELLEILDGHGIPYKTSSYRAEKEVRVIASQSLSFVCSMYV